jgi:hypothetical protein
MKQYMLSMVTPTGGEPPAPEVLERVMTEIYAIRDELKAQDAWVFGNGLHAPSSATVVRLEGDQLLTVDGPFAEGKEYVGGISIIRAPDLDTALGWARRYTRVTTLATEVRPFVDQPES